jgi:hypothetical protein
MTKIEATGPLCSLSNRMPPPPAAMLSACEIAAIRSWIAAGAPGPAGGADAGADAPGDAVSDASDDGNADANADTGADAIEPGVCTSTQHCDPVSETCIEVMQSATGDCSMRWECYSHAPEDETVEHACPPEVATFCGCDGTTFDASYGCAYRPYDHIGACGDGHSCDATRVRCADAPPTCPDGQAPAVTAGCWGPCVPIAMCRCDQNWQCPQRDRYRCSLLPDFRCGPIPPAADAGTDA